MRNISQAVKTQPAPKSRTRWARWTVFAVVATLTLFAIQHQPQTAIALQGEAIPAPGYAFLTLNFDDSNLNLAAAARNTTVRQALNLAIDRATLVFDVLEGQGVPQYVPVDIAGAVGEEFFVGRNNTCADFDAAGLVSADNPCVDGVWSLNNGLSLPVVYLPSPAASATAQQLGCLFDFDSCLAQANTLLDDAGLTRNADGVREIPADFGGFGNEGGLFEIGLIIQDDNATRAAYTEIVCSAWLTLGVACETLATPTQEIFGVLLNGMWSGTITLGFGTSSPPDGAATVRCGGSLHFYHVSCDPGADSGPAAPTADEQTLEGEWLAGFYDDWQNAFIELTPFFTLATALAVPPEPQEGDGG